MKKFLAAAVAAGLVAVSAAAVIAILPAQATTFSLRTIYVASGVYDSGDANGVGTATSVHCSNLSGKSATMRVSFYGAAGNFEGASNFTLTNLSTLTVSTHDTLFIESPTNTGAIFQGVLNVQSTESGVFCSAMLVDASGGSPAGMTDVPVGIALHMVRYNPHPGTVE